MKPDYYTKGGMECFDAIKAATEGLTGYEGFLTGNIVKYAWRWNDKGGVADLEKAAEYVRKLIELRAPENRPYTLNELKALPDGARVWVESSPAVCGILRGFAIRGWHTKRGGELQNARGIGLQIDNPAANVHWRAWPDEPSAQDKAAWPVGGGATCRG